MLSTIARAELFLRAVADSPASLDAARARELASALLAHRQAVALAYGLPLPPDGSENGGGERGEAARGAEPRPLVLTHPAAIDFGGAGDLCLASRSPSHDLVEVADAMRALFPKAAHDCLLRECSIVDSYDTARARLTSAEARR